MDDPDKKNMSEKGWWCTEVAAAREALKNELAAALESTS